MRNVARMKKPKSLSDNALRWTIELLHEIRKKGSYTKVDDVIKNRYRQPDVQDTLSTMYNNHCCYCESVIGKEYATYGRIEHLKPKSEFPEDSFCWSNLHWSCEVCNTSYKKDKWDYINPILDPCVDNISHHLVLDMLTGEYDMNKSSNRGRTTIEHAGLNRLGLVKGRRTKVVELSANYKQHRSNGNEKMFIEFYNRIKDDYDYTSVYEAFLEEIYSNIND